MASASQPPRGTGVTISHSRQISARTSQMTTARSTSRAYSSLRNDSTLFRASGSIFITTSVANKLSRSPGLGRTTSSRLSRKVAAAGAQSKGTRMRMDGRPWASLASIARAPNDDEAFPAPGEGHKMSARPQIYSYTSLHHRISLNITGTHIWTISSPATSA